MHYLYTERKKKNKENLVILKFVCKFVSDGWSSPTQVGAIKTFFHIYGKNFLNIRIRRFPLPLLRGTFLKNEEKTKKDLDISKLVCTFAM